MVVVVVVTAEADVVVVGRSLGRGAEQCDPGRNGNNKKTERRPDPCPLAKRPESSTSAPYPVL